MAAIQDATGNDAVSLVAQSVTNNTLDTTPPVFASAAVNTNVLTMTYTEMGLLNNATALGNAFSVISGDSANPVTTVAVDVNAKTVTLTLATAVLPAQVVTIAYNDPSADNDVNAIQDVAGNDAVSFTAQTVTNNTLDTTPPVFASAAVNANVLTITYIEDALNSTTALANAFSVVSAGAANPVTAVAVDASLKTITLTLTNAAINGQTVTVAYNDPTTGNDVNAVQDALGNDAITFAAQNVNNVTVAVVVPVVVTPPIVVVPVTLPLTTNTSTGSTNDKILSPVEVAKYVKYGTKDADTITGTSSKDWIYGLGGNDTIVGGSYSDTLLGGAGDDSLNGGSHSSGASYSGVDYLIGGSGIDHLIGGNGINSDKDYFIFGTGDTGVGTAYDVIEDFRVKYDVIDLAGTQVAGSVGFGVLLTFLPLVTLDVPDFTAANQVRVIGDFDNNQTLVQINLDSDFSTVEAEIGLTGLMNLTAANFILTKPV